VTASVEARGRRRWLELRARGIAADLDEVTGQVRLRDAQDRDRAAAPLLAAADALLLDTTALDADATFAVALDLLRSRI
jgi:cytidylate kinase